MDLFDYGRRQAILERDRGMALAAKAEDQHQPDWNDQALALICDLARRQQLIHVDDVRPRIAAACPFQFMGLGLDARHPRPGHRKKRRASAVIRSQAARA
jgi:hypothetical protein